MRRVNGAIVGSPNVPTSSSASGRFDLNEIQLANVGGDWPVPPSPEDPYFKNTTLLLHGDGTNGAQNNTFLDSSTNNFTITRNGNTTQGSFSPFSPAGWSNYFGESGANCLQFANNVALQMGTSDFTIEGWFYPTKGGSERTWYVQGLNSAGGLSLFVGTGGVRFRASGVTDLLYTGTISGWTHIAFIRSGTTRIIYVNGVSVATDTLSFNNNDATTLEIGAPAKNESDTYRYYGYISNARIVKGTVVHPGPFTPSTTPLTAIANTSLLTCQSNRFIDNSANNFAITVNGSPSVQAFSPFAPNTITPVSYGAYFDGTDDRLQINYSTPPTISGDFTWETWVYDIGATANGTLLGWRSGSSGWQGFLIQRNSGANNLSVSITSGGVTITQTSGTYTKNAWHHVALTRSGSTVTLWINGVSAGTATYNSSIAPGTSYWIGQDPFNIISSTYFTGYISNQRFVNGTAIYTTPFPPPTAPLTAVSGTGVLTCQSTRFVDNSANNFAITVNGNTQLSAFNPFGETVTSLVAYNPAIHGGSGYFDGNGDYLSLPAGSSWLFTGDHCLEAWLYWTNSTATIIYATGGPSSTDQFGIFPGGEGIWWGATGQSSAVDPTLNSWNHVCVTRQGSTIRRFLNGKLITTSTNSSNIGTNSGIPYIGARTGSNLYFPGNIADLRIINGSVPTEYQTSSTTIGVQAFLPPTAPLTLTSQGATSAHVKLLLNFTNGGIFDSTAKNVLETVGNAQISTSVKKYGTGSMYFDGTGDMVTMRPGPAFVFGTGDFTIEGWAYATSLESGFGSIIYSQATSGLNYLVVVVSPGGIVQCVINNAAAVDSPSTISLNTWFHFAVVRNSGSLKVYLNGVGGTAASRTTDLTNITYIPALGKYQQAEANTWRGYIDDFRITKGVARHTLNFDPPTKAYSDY
jgi:hypothetical protein